jgi:hypothetical protein
MIDLVRMCLAGKGSGVRIPDAPPLNQVQNEPLGLWPNGSFVVLTAKLTAKRFGRTKVSGSVETWAAPSVLICRGAGCGPHGGIGKASTANPKIN